MIKGLFTIENSVGSQGPAAVSCCCHSLAPLVKRVEPKVAGILLLLVQLLVAALLGWLVFGDIPDATSFVGAAIIIGCGIVLLRSTKPARARA